MTQSPLSLFQALAIITALVAAFWDVRTRRVPNLLTFGASGVALALHTALAGPSGIATGAAGWLVGCGVFLPLFLLRGMGGGDIKLMGALGACLGASAILWAAVLTALAGAVLGVGVALWHGYLRQALTNVLHALGLWVVSGIRPLPNLTLETNPGPRLAYAVPILIGTVTTVWGQL